MRPAFSPEATQVLQSLVLTVPQGQLASTNLKLTPHQPTLAAQCGAFYSWGHINAPGSRIHKRLSVGQSCCQSLRPSPCRQSYLL